MNDNNNQDELKQLSAWLVTLGIVFIFVFFVGWIWLWAINVVPIRDSFSHDRFSILEPKEYFELRDKGIKSVIEGLKVVATIFGGIAILGNLFYAAKRAKALDASAIAANATAKAALENAKAALKNAEAAQDKQITERFTKAVEQLASQEIAIRLGGIYALERIAKNSQDDHWTIMEVLTAFVREKCLLKEEEEGEREQLPKIPTDIQAALTVIGRRDMEKDPENQKLDLSKVNIASANLREANLQGANLYQANLQGADLTKAQLQGADLGNTNLQQAHIIEANLQGAILTEANLKGAFLNGTNLQQTDLMAAILEGVQLSSADLRKSLLKRANLQSTRLCNAQLQGADIRQADFSGASLLDANLEGAFIDLADFRNAYQLTQQQVDSARGQARLPAYLKNQRSGSN
ncbi:MAG: pentapeptide repeat-containing protein [Cyanobacteriota bacterium]